MGFTVQKGKKHDYNQKQQLSHEAQKSDLLDLQARFNSGSYLHCDLQTHLIYSCMKRILFIIMVVGLMTMLNQTVQAQSDAGKSGQTQADLDAMNAKAQEEQKSPELKAYEKKMEKERKAKEKRNAITRKKAEKKADKRMANSKSKTRNKKKKYVKTHGGK